MINLLSKENIQDIYPLSPIQEGMYFESLLDENTNAYIQQVSFDIKGVFDLKTFQKALDLLAQRHDVLRTVFSNKKEDKLLQVVLKKYPLNCLYEDVSLISSKKEYISSLKKKMRLSEFDLANGPLFKSLVLRLAENQHTIVFTFHHILLDGWSLFKLLNELMFFYKEENALLEPTIPYKNFIKWIALKNKKDSIEYWKNYLFNFSIPSQIPIKKKTELFTKATEQILFNRETSKKVYDYTRSFQVTGYNLFSSIWGFLLSRFNNTNSVVFGAVISGRDAQIEGLNEIMGITINTIPVQMKFEEENLFVKHINESQLNFISSLEHGYMPLTEVQTLSSLKAALFDHIFVYENISWNDINTNSNEKKILQISNYKSEDHTHYNFEINIHPQEEILVQFIYNEEAVDTNFVKIIAKEFKRILMKVVTNSSVKVKDLMDSEVQNKPLKEMVIGDF